MERIQVFKALSDPTRLQIVKILLRRERCACELPRMVGKAQPTVSLQLKKLRAAGILSYRRQGTKLMYRVCNPKVRRILELVR